VRPVLVLCPDRESVSSRGLEGDLRGVVPPHPGFPALLLQLQSAQFLLPAFLAIPQLLAVLVHAHAVAPHHVQVLVALQRKLLRILGQPRVPVARQRSCWMRGPRLAQKPGAPCSDRAGLPQVARAVELRIAGREETVVGDDVNVVPSQNLPVGVLVADAGVEAGVGRLRALKQQPPLLVEEAVVALRRQRRRGRFKQAKS